MNNPIRFEQLDRLFSHTPTYHASNAAGGEQDASFFGNSEALFKTLYPPVDEDPQLVKTNDEKPKAERAKPLTACFYPMASHLPNHGFTQEFLSRPRTIKPDFKRKHTRYFPPPSLLTKAEVSTSTKSSNIEPAIPKSPLPVVKLPPRSSHEDEGRAPEDDEAVIRPSIFDPSTSTRIAETEDCKDQEVDEGFEDIDTEADEDDWTVIFPEAAIVQVYVCEKATHPLTNWSCHRCGWTAV